MKTLIILGHPDEKSLCASIAEAYLKGAKEKGADIELLKLSDLKFNLNLKYGYHKVQNLEDDLKHAQDLIGSASRLVFIYPVWWGGVPALLKGFIDRVFLPGFAFVYEKESDNYTPLLTNKSARLIVTSSSNILWLYLNYMHPAVNMMKKSLLEFCGVDPVEVTSYSNLKNVSEKKIDSILYETYRLGLNDH